MPLRQVSLALYGDDYFKGYWAYVVWDLGGAGAAPQGEKKPITGYTSLTGNFIVADEKWIDVYSLVGICQADGERIDIKGEGDLACPFKHYLCNKCAIWDAEEERCSLLSIAINTKRI